MKDNKLVETNNIIAGTEAVRYLLSRPIAHQPGLAMIHGAPGLGKTQFSRRTAQKYNYVYFSAKKADTPKAFIAELTKLLLARYYPEATPYITGSKSTLFYQCIAILNQNTTAAHMPIIFIDEVDNIIHYEHESIIGMLRDIVDNTAAAVVLIGMQDLKNKIIKLNSHYYNRVVYFCEFKALTKKDVSVLCRELSEIELAPDLIAHTHDLARGDARKIVKALRLYEEIARTAGTHALDMKSYQQLVRSASHRVEQHTDAAKTPTPVEQHTDAAKTPTPVEHGAAELLFGRENATTPVEQHSDAAKLPPAPSGAISHSEGASAPRTKAYYPHKPLPGDTTSLEKP